MFALRCGDAVSGGECIDRFANGNDDPGDFMSWDARQYDSSAQDTGAHGNVVRTDAAKGNLYDDLARARHGVGEGFAVQRSLDGPGFAENECAHRCRATGLRSG
jgi:hypothetical protein